MEEKKLTGEAQQTCLRSLAKFKESEDQYEFIREGSVIRVRGGKREYIIRLSGPCVHVMTRVTVCLRRCTY